MLGPQTSELPRCGQVKLQPQPPREERRGGGGWVGAFLFEFVFVLLLCCRLSSSFAQLERADRTVDEPVYDVDVR